jgi:PAS domain S-box-containing protein
VALAEAALEHRMTGEATMATIYVGRGDDTLTAALARVPIGEQQGACGRAAHLRQAVIAADIQTNPHMVQWRALAQAHGVRACWSFPLHAPGGGVIGTLAFYHRTTCTPESERRRRLYEAVLSTTPDLVYVFDLEHRFTYANAVLLQMWGRTWEEAIGRNCLELGYPDWHAEMHGREIEQIKATKKPVRGEVPFHGTFGPRVYEYILMPVLGPDGEVEAVAGTTRDVTERKQFEDELLASQQRALAAAPAAAPDAFILDIGMAGMDGYELARRLRAQAACRGALFIALTGYGQPGDRELSRQAGFDLHFVKPVDAGQLLDALHQRAALSCGRRSS